MSSSVVGTSTPYQKSLDHCSGHFPVYLFCTTKLSEKGNSSTFFPNCMSVTVLSPLLPTLPSLKKKKDISTPQLCYDNKVNKAPGPIIRISPNEIHLNDPANYDKIYNVLSKFTKDPSFYGPIEGPVRTPVILTVISNEAHRARRSALNPFFSRRSVLDLETVVRSKSLLFCEILSSALSKDEIDLEHESKDKKKAFNAHGAIRAFATDVITEYAYANCWNFLDEEDFGAWYPRAIRAVQTMFVWFQTFPGLIPVFGWVPDRVNMLLFPPFRKWFESLDVSISLESCSLLPRFPPCSFDFPFK